MKLYEIANALADESSYLNQETGEVDVELLDKLSVAYDQKVDSICTIIGEYDSEIAYLEQEIARLADMKKRRQKRIDGLKNYLTFCIADKWSNSRYTVSVRSTQAVEADVDKIPDEYKRTTIKVEPDKKKLADVLKGGVEIPGASLVTRRSTTIK